MPNPITQYHKYGPTNTIDIAKFIAVLLMVIDHLGVYFFFDEAWLRAIGRASFPIWSFFAGYSVPGRFRYIIVISAILLILLDAAIISPIFPFNILVTILACRAYINYLEKDNKFEKWSALNLSIILLVLLVWLPLTNMLFEYGSLAFMLALCGMLQRRQPGHLNTKIAFGITTIAYIFIEFFLFGFPVSYFIIVSSGVIVVMYFLANFRKIPLPFVEKYNILSKGINFTARNSLYFYFFHLVLFAILSKLIYPERYTVFKWF